MIIFGQKLIQSAFKLHICQLQGILFNIEGLTFNGNTVFHVCSGPVNFLFSSYFLLGF